MARFDPVCLLVAVFIAACRLPNAQAMRIAVSFEIVATQGVQHVFGEPSENVSLTETIFDDLFFPAFPNVKTGGPVRVEPKECWQSMRESIGTIRRSDRGEAVKSDCTSRRRWWISMRLIDSRQAFLPQFCHKLPGV